MMDNREIDLLVARKVMGWIEVEKGEFTGFDFVGKRPLINDTHSRDSFLIPHYSTDISAAWQVAGKLIEIRFYPVIWVKPGIVQLYCHNEVCTIEEKGTIPLAICLAALKAVGVDL